jgi:hypothetical protein
MLYFLKKIYDFKLLYANQKYIDKSKDLTVFTCKGVLSFDDAMPVVEAFYDGDPTKHVLWDMTETTEIHLTSEEVKQIATFPPRIEGKREFGQDSFCGSEGHSLWFIKDV